MRAELDEIDIERIAQVVAGDMQHWIGIVAFLILTELETRMSALEDAVARSVASQEALIAKLNEVIAGQGNQQGVTDMLNAESDKVDAAVAAVPPA